MQRVIQFRVILEAMQREEKGDKHEVRNDRIFAVPDNSQADRDLQEVKDLTPETREELQKFFQVTDALQHKAIRFLDWRGPKVAERVIQKGEKRFAKG